MDMNTISANQYAHKIGIEEEKESIWASYVDELTERTMKGDYSTISREWIEEQLSSHEGYWDCVNRLTIAVSAKKDANEIAVIAAEIKGITEAFVRIKAIDLSVEVLR